MKACLLIALAFVALTAANLPTTFDARENWSQCQFQILNQQRCGSCWDFSAMESFGDRLCIAGEAPSGTITSVEPPLECTRYKGCNGGWPSAAWGWVIDNGNPTCTNLCTEGCAPYDLARAPSTIPECHPGTCDSGSNWQVWNNASLYKDLARKSPSVYQQELFTYGSLQMCFDEYNNFGSFFHNQPTGIYNTTTGATYIGGHCVKAIGWGHEDGLDYWLIANSWGTGFADKGYFKFLRGTNLCNMEYHVSEGFTLTQSIAVAEAEARGHVIPTIAPEEVAEPAYGGGGMWHKQPKEALVSDFLIEAGKAAVELVEGDHTFKAVESAMTQSAGGINMEMVVRTEEGRALSVKLFRTLDMKYELVE